MPDVRDWSRNRAMWIGVLERQTGEGVDVWKRRIAREQIRDEPSLRAWLIRRHVTGYAQSLLVSVVEFDREARRLPRLAYDDNS